MDTDNYKDAVEYIKESSIYTNKRYAWLKALIDKCLNDTLVEQDIIDTVNLKLKIDIDNDTDDSGDVIEEANELDSEGDLDKLSARFNIKEIISIEEAINAGLLEVQKPIALKKGLNIFYGKNGAGKSSLYHPICKTLGYNKLVTSKINSESKISSFRLKAISENNVENEFSWRTGEENTKCNIKIFDSSISNYLVESDQENNFNISHLKSEYFTLLHSLFDEISKILSQTDKKLTEKKLNKREVINTTFAEFFDRDTSIWTKEKIQGTIQSEAEIESLSQLESRYKILERNDSDSVIKNIATAKEQIRTILSNFGTYQQVKSETGKPENRWILKYDKNYFTSLKNDLDNFINAKLAYEKKGLEALSGNISDEWIKSEKWNTFIKSSIDFVKTLDSKEILKYKDEKCPYCLQDLANSKVKKLIAAYYEIQNELRTKLKEYEDDFSNIESDLNKTVEFKDKIEKANAIIESEFKHTGIQNKKIKTFEIWNEIGEIIQGIKERKSIAIKESFIKEVELLWTEYVKLFEKYHNQILNFYSNTESKIEVVAKLKGEAKPYQFNKKIFNQKSNLIDFLETEETLSILNNLISDISSIKQALSSIETRFTKEEPLKIFRSFLEKEYENFNFTPPESWNISTTTHGQSNKRIYSLGDKKISDIFSEGERKIHALADFFAESELNNYKGVFIFDDPVNSLDEERMEYVRDRIIQLVEDGNQIIVFTHNLVFLNLLADTQNDKLNILNRLSDQVIIESDIKMDSQQELSKILKEIDKRMKEFKLVDADSINIMELRNVYDLISGYLETYVEGKIFKDIISRYRPNIRMHSLDKMDSLDYNKIKKILSLYNQTSRKGSRHSQPIGSPKPKYLDLSKHYDELKNDFPLN